MDANTSLEVELIEDSYNWSEWMQPLGCKWGGHTSSKYTKLRGEECVRVFRFIRRKDLAPELVQALIAEFEDPVHDQDVICMLKVNISSDTYCAPPMVCLPYLRLKRLEHVPSRVPHHEITEFLKDKFEIIKFAHQTVAGSYVN